MRKRNKKINPHRWIKQWWFIDTYNYVKLGWFKKTSKFKVRATTYNTAQRKLLAHFPTAEVFTVENCDYKKDFHERFTVK